LRLCCSSARTSSTYRGGVAQGAHGARNSDEISRHRGGSPRSLDCSACTRCRSLKASSSW
jgi:hypothetical protein